MTDYTLFGCVLNDCLHVMCVLVGFPVDSLWCNNPTSGLQTFDLKGRTQWSWRYAPFQISVAKDYLCFSNDNMLHALLFFFLLVYVVVGLDTESSDAESQN